MNLPVALAAIEAAQVTLDLTSVLSDAAWDIYVRDRSHPLWLAYLEADADRKAAWSTWQQACRDRDAAWEQERAEILGAKA